MAAYKDVSALYRQALGSLIERLKPDTNILAIILEGSMAYDTVWEKSDIDRKKDTLTSLSTASCSRRGFRGARNICRAARRNA